MNPFESVVARRPLYDDHYQRMECDRCGRPAAVRELVAYDMVCLRCLRGDMGCTAAKSAER